VEGEAVLSVRVGREAVRVSLRRDTEGVEPVTEAEPPEGVKDSVVVGVWDTVSLRASDRVSVGVDVRLWDKESVNVTVPTKLRVVVYDTVTVVDTEADRVREAVGPVGLRETDCVAEDRVAWLGVSETEGVAELVGVDVGLWTWLQVTEWDVVRLRLHETTSEGLPDRVGVGVTDWDAVREKE